MIFVDACFQKPVAHTPIWMMRQAGRYLSEYLAVRAKTKNFVEFCRAPELACEVTLQPVDILGVDAAILFSDILVVPLEMGMDLELIEKQGPVFHDPIRTEADYERLSDNAPTNLEYVYEAIRLIRKNLAADKALIGFAGSPWTLATYMVEGSGSKTYSVIKKMLYANPALLHKILQKNTDAVIEYLKNQIRSGVNAVQVFDSWAGALEESAFLEFSWKYMKQISESIKQEFPHIPVILFSKGIGGYLEKIDGVFDVFGVDWGTPLDRAKKLLYPKYALQGNMEPMRLYSKDAIKAGVDEIHSIMGKGDGFIFNLGHGMQPDFDRNHAKYLVDYVHEVFKR